MAETTGRPVLATGLFGDLVLPDPVAPGQAAERQALAAQAAAYAAAARSPATLRAYRSAWRQYDAWCRDLGFEPLAGEAGQVGMYLTRAAERLAVASLQVHLAAIVAAHRLAGQQLDPGHPSIALLLDGLRRRKGTAPARQAAPITPDLLARMVRAQPCSPLGLRNRAMLLVGFGAALRRAELVALDAGDLRFVEGRGVVVRLRRSKTDPTGAGQEVAIWGAADPDLCAPAALQAWLAWLQPARGDQPLFVGFRPTGVPTGKRLSDKAVVRLIQATAEGVGAADPDLIAGSRGPLAASLAPRYSGHSLRAGLATAAAVAEAQLHDVMRQTRHKSPEMARRYMRASDLWRNNVTETVLRKRR